MSFRKGVLLSCLLGKKFYFLFFSEKKVKVPPLSPVSLSPSENFSFLLQHVILILVQLSTSITLKRCTHASAFTLIIIYHFDMVDTVSFGLLIEGEGEYG